MSDSDLNLAIHTEVEGWRKVDGYVGWCRILGGFVCRSGNDTIPDYCHDYGWCLRQVEKYKLRIRQTHIATARWRVSSPDDFSAEKFDDSLCRAICLAVLEIHRRKQ